MKTLTTALLFSISLLFGDFAFQDCGCGESSSPGIVGEVQQSFVLAPPVTSRLVSTDPVPNPFVSTDPTPPAPVLRAIIKGPTEVLAGTLLFLSNEDSTGDNKVWLIDEELKSQSASCGSNIFFAIPKPGKYRFGLIVANREAQIEYAYHTVTVKAYPGTPPTTDPPVDPPTDPQPPTQLPLQEITKASKNGVVTLADPTTAAALVVALEEVVGKLADDLDSAKKQVTTAIETTLLFRSPASRSKDWLNLWRVPIQTILTNSPPRNTAEYKQVVQAMIAGLKP